MIQAEESGGRLTHGYLEFEVNEDRAGRIGRCAAGTAQESRGKGV
jgi:hypothetical protein